MTRIRPREVSGLPKTGKLTAAEKREVRICEFCNDEFATDEHHVGQGATREVTDPYPELKLDMCRSCHDEIHEQKAKREIGLALLVRAGRGTVAAICELFYRVTGRRFPELSRVKKWVNRLGAR